MTWLRRTAGLLAVALALAGCAEGSAASPAASPAPTAVPANRSFPVTMKDDDGVSVTIPSAPDRIVTWGPSITETIYALGLGRDLVGVSGPYDDYPPAALHVTRVGGPSGVSPDVEKLVSLRPDLVLAIEGGDAWKQRLRSLGIKVFTINSTSFADTLHDIRTIGRLTDRAAAAAALTDRMASGARQIQAKVAGEPPVSCFFEVSYPPLYTVGPGSFIYGLLRMAGCRPVTASATTPYPQWSVDALVKEDPQVYLAGSAPGVSPPAISGRPGFDGLAAVRDHRVYVVNSNLVTRQGPRLVQGLRALAGALHPGAFAA